MMLKWPHFGQVGKLASTFRFPIDTTLLRPPETSSRLPSSMPAAACIVRSSRFSSIAMPFFSQPPDAMFGLPMRGHRVPRTGALGDPRTARTTPDACARGRPALLAVDSRRLGIRGSRRSVPCDRDGARSGRARAKAECALALRLGRPSNACPCFRPARQTRGGRVPYRCTPGPHSSAAISRSLNFCTFIDGVIGKSSTKNTRLGTL